MWLLPLLVGVHWTQCQALLSCRRVCVLMSGEWLAGSASTSSRLRSVCGLRHPNGGACPKLWYSALQRVGYVFLC